MIIVTGGAGFVGSNLVKALNERGSEDVMVVDDFTDGRKLRNLIDCELYDVVDKEVFREWLEAGRDLGEPIDAVFHQGASSNTMEWDGRYMLRANYDYPKLLLSYCTEREIPLIYASSAAVYGEGPVFKEERPFERPLNPYGYSKLLFDQHTRRLRQRFRSQVVGLRYFNVYGPREAHKGNMASIAYQHWCQLQEGDRVQLFSGSDGYGDGEQRRDFVWVGDCVAVNLWLLDHPDVSGIFNVGTGRAQAFNDVARAVIAAVGHGEIEYISLLEMLRDGYQSFTEADISALRKAGYTERFLPVEEGVARYVAWLDKR